ERLFQFPSARPYVKDAFHSYVIEGRDGAVDPRRAGTKAAALYRFQVPARGSVVLRFRLTSEEQNPPVAFDSGFDALVDRRRREADDFYAAFLARGMTPEESRVARQAYAGLLWSKQFYHFIVRDWLEGDPSEPRPPDSRESGRNRDWKHLFSR